MDTIQIKDKMFTVSIKEQDILKEVTRVANEINRDLAGKNPLFLSVLNHPLRNFFRETRLLPRGIFYGSYQRSYRH